MAVMMIMNWSGVTTEQYEQARGKVKWESNTPKGAIAHFAAHDGKGMRITDIWDSGEDFQSFVDNRLIPAVAEIGIEGQPDVEIYPLHAKFTPGL